MSFTGLRLTNDGKEQLTKSLDDSALKFSYIVLGDGNYNGSLTSKKALEHEVMRLPVQYVSRKNNDEVVIQADWRSQDVPMAFYFREVGVIGNGKLCYYDNAGEDAEWIDPENANVTFSRRQRITLKVSDEVNIEIFTASGLYALDADMQAVCNPDFEESIDLENINAKESIFDIFGKIKKAISSLISHLSDKTMHSDTKNTAGASNTGDKLFLIGAPEQSDYPQTYSHDTAYIGRDGCLYSGGKIVATKQQLDDLTDAIYAQAVAYADQIKSDIYGGTPSVTLDTIAEIAKALEDNDNVVRVITTELGKKAAQAELDTHVNNKNNPHGVTKAHVGLGNVNNTADADKRVKYASASGNADTVDGHHFNWSGQSGQPAWVWGGNDSTNQYVYDPSNFNVAFATRASVIRDSADSRGITMTYSKAAQSSTSWLASWNGYELGTISPSNVTVGKADFASSAGKATNDGNGANIANTYLKRSGGKVDWIGLDALYSKTDRGNVKLLNNWSQWYLHQTYANELSLDYKENGATAGGLAIWGAGIWPLVDNKVILGTTDRRWKQIYAITSTISTSDKNLKRNIKSLLDDERYLKFFKLLSPKSFLFKNGESGRTHIGFISQDVEAALEAAGLTSLDFAGFCKDVKMKEVPDKDAEPDKDGNYPSKWIEDLDENGNVQYLYSLRYEEFIALNSAMIQHQQKEIGELKERADEQDEDIKMLQEQIKQLIKSA